MEKRQQRAWGNQEQEWTGAWWEEKSLKPNPITWLKQCNVKRARGEFCMMSISTCTFTDRKAVGTECRRKPLSFQITCECFTLKTTWFYRSETPGSGREGFAVWPAPFVLSHIYETWCGVFIQHIWMGFLSTELEVSWARCLRFSIQRLQWNDGCQHLLPALRLSGA